MFAGRLAELVILERVLVQTRGGNAQHFLLAGERGIGKSSLMLAVRLIASGQMPSLSGQTFKFLVLELELDPTSTYRQLVVQIAGALRRALTPFEKSREALREVWDVVKRIEAMGMRYHSEEQPTETHELMDNLVSAFVESARTLGENAEGVLILIDEADKAPSDAQLGSFVKVFTDRLTKQQCDNVALGVAGVTGIVQKLRSSHESAPRVFSILNLEPLELDESKSVVRQGLTHGNSKNDLPVTITDEALTLLASVSEGFPHFIQQFAYCAFEEDADDVISDVDVAAGAIGENGALDQLGQKYFQQMFFEKINSNEYRAVLRAMAQSDSPDGWVTKEQIRQATGLKETTLGNAIHTLKDKEIILPKSGEKGVYRLPNRSFAAWIRARQLGDQPLPEPPPAGHSEA